MRSRVGAGRPAGLTGLAAYEPRLLPLARCAACRAEFQGTESWLQTQQHMAAARRLTHDKSKSLHRQYCPASPAASATSRHQPGLEHGGRHCGHRCSSPAAPQGAVPARPRRRRGVHPTFTYKHCIHRVQGCDQLCCAMSSAVHLAQGPGYSSGTRQGPPDARTQCVAIDSTSLLAVRCDAVSHACKQGADVGMDAAWQRTMVL